MGCSARANTCSRSFVGRSRLTFKDVTYFYRWSQGEQNEFTPEKQENLATWSDMITINGYPDVGNGDQLAARANAMLKNYKGAKAMVLKTDSVPQTADRPAERLIAVVFGRPKFIEVAFARFKLVNGEGCSVVYSHRIHGEKIGDQMSAWLSANGPAVEKALMQWNSVPSPRRSRKSCSASGAERDRACLWHGRRSGSQGAASA